MKKQQITSLDGSRDCPRGAYGSKARVLSVLAAAGWRTPSGFAVGAGVYRRFFEQSGIRAKTIMELGRKRREDMRWEELWDASLRIRNLFLKAPIPEEIETAVLAAVASICGEGPLAIRSSSLSEDGEESSFAGIHESYVNISGPESVIKHLKLVWASLFSDRALAYRNGFDELETGSMAVVIQTMVHGEISGVGFGMHPGNDSEAVIESVPGLNRALVDGETEPDRIIMSRATGNILKKTSAPRGKSKPRTGPLSEAGAQEVFSTLMKLEESFGRPQDMEWTFSGGRLYILQSRPITILKKKATGRLAFDLSLRRSYENLKKLEDKIENELAPAMIREAQEMGRINLSAFSDEQLKREIGRRKEILKKWKDVYWEDFIPFAHGTRLFGEVYNDKISPQDPYEFIELIKGRGTESIKRNLRLLELAKKLKKSGKSPDADIEALVKEFGLMLPGAENPGAGRKMMLSFIEKLQDANILKNNPSKQADILKKKFVASFTAKERPLARDMLSLAGKSYAMRDDDNIYLGRIEQELNRVVYESSRRAGKRCAGKALCENYEEAMRSARGTKRIPGKKKFSKTPLSQSSPKARQLRGQSASAGIARGKARVINTTEDLFLFQKNEILVCDSIDPNMTFVMPLAAGVAERRGGMLVHGAIIAREYGIPCVTGIPGAVSRINTGDILTVDGYFGLVTINSGDDAR